MPSFRSPLLSFIAALVLSTTAEAPAVAQSSTSSAPSATVTEPDNPIAELWQQHQTAISLGTLLLLSYLGVLGFRPLLLLKLPSSDLSIPGTSWKIPLGWVRFLKYRDRVLDAWVNQHWQTAQTKFLNIRTVEDRATHISLLVRLDKMSINDLNGHHLMPTFKNMPAVLLLTGEGGSGKTSLACQIAQWGMNRQLSLHRMIPVLIEDELDDQLTFLEAIRGKLGDLTNQSIALELVEKLLQRQRVLVIVDHLSEMSDATRSQIKPLLTDSPVKAIIVTSRLEESLGGVSKTILRPLQIEANRLWPFMSAYLEATGKEKLFGDDEYSDASDRLRRMAGERPITVLLARLYIDSWVKKREGEGGILPDSVPKLMREYLTKLNQNIDPQNKRDDLDIQRDAKIGSALVRGTEENQAIPSR